LVELECRTCHSGIHATKRRRSTASSNGVPGMFSLFHAASLTLFPGY
jgi:hypothetical protein